MTLKVIDSQHGRLS